MILLYNWLSDIYCTPGPLNSNLIKTENAVPSNPENNAKIKYKLPISLALVEKNHLSMFILIEAIFFVWVSERSEVSLFKLNRMNILCVNYYIPIYLCICININI